MSGTLKEVIKALVGVLTSPDSSSSSSSPPSSSSYQLPDQAQEVVRLYLDRHDDIDDQDSQRLHDELLNLHARLVAENADRRPEFLAALCQLRPAVLGEDRMMEWWKILVRPTFDQLGRDGNVTPALRDFLLAVLVYDDDEDADGELAIASEAYTQELLDLYIEKTSLPGIDHAGPLAVDDEARLVGCHLESILVDFGRRKPKSLLVAIDTLLEIKEHRRQALSLLCTFVRFQPPHLHQVVHTSLIDHLLQCLMIDTSTTVVSLALLSLVMFLPHIPSSLVPYLPRLFVVYSRLLCWDRYYGPRGDGTGPARESAASEGGEDDETGDDDDDGDDEFDDDENLDENDGRGKAAAAAAPNACWAYTDSRWDKLQSSFNVADATIRDLTPYYSFLYGLYPENFMGFIRKPNRYLRNARFPGLDRLDLDQDVIRQRTERYRRVHLLHPNFYNTTVENELSDLSRFVQCEPSDIVAQCMELCVSTAPPPLMPRAEVPTSQPLVSKAHVATEDIPAGPQLSGKGACDEGGDEEDDEDDDDEGDDDDDDDEDEDEDATTKKKKKKKTTTTTTSTVKEKSSAGDKVSAEAGTNDSQAVNVATGKPFGLLKESQHGISRASNEMMMMTTTTTTATTTTNTTTTPTKTTTRTTPASAAEDSPTLPSTVVPPPRDGHVREMLQAHGLLRSLFQASQVEPASTAVYDTPPMTMTSADAAAVIARLGAYLNSLANMPDRAPAIRPGSTDVPKDMALLQREVLLLRNDLNFERFLKQQHLSHIGQLQRKHIHEATAESDTQNLIRTNRALKFRAEEARRAYSSLQKETTAGRNHSKKWENELNGRTRSLREQQKRWEMEEQRLRQELHLTQDAAERLRGLLMDSEARELGARQKLEALQSTVDELERLRDEVDTLDRRLRAYERREEEFEHARRNEEMAFTQLETARLRLQARDAERERLQKVYEDRIVELESRLRDAETATPNQTPQALQAMIDSALASSRSRFDNLRKVYNRLLTRYGELEIAYMDLQAATELDGSMAVSAAAAAATSPRRLGLSRSPGELDPFGDDGQTVVEPSASGSGSGGRRGDVGSGSGSEALVNGYDDYRGRSMMMRQPPPGTASYSLPSRPGQFDHLHGHMAIDMHDPGMRAVSPDTVIPSNKKHSSDGTTVSGGSVRSGSRSDSGATVEEPKKTKIKPNSGVRVYGRGGVQNIGKKEKNKVDGNGRSNGKGMGSVKNSASRMGFRGLSTSS